MPPKPHPKNLTDLVKLIGKEVHTIDNDGVPISKDERLIRLLWDIALGYEETTRDDDGNESIFKHKPQKWAMQEIIARREGSIPAPASDVGNRMSAAKQVRDLVKNRLNGLVVKKDESTNGK